MMSSIIMIIIAAVVVALAIASDRWLQRELRSMTDDQLLGQIEDANDWLESAPELRAEYERRHGRKS